MVSYLILLIIGVSHEMGILRLAGGRLPISAAGQESDDFQIGALVGHVVNSFSATILDVVEHVAWEGHVVVDGKGKNRSGR